MAYVGSGNLKSELVNRINELEKGPANVSMSPNTALLNYSAYTNSSYVLGGILYLQCAIVLSKATDWNSSELTLFTIQDAACRPGSERTVSRMCLIVKGSGGTGFVSRGIKVKTDGKVVFVNSSGGTQEVATVVIPGVGVLL